MYFAQHTQTGERTDTFDEPWDALDVAEDTGWEDSEVLLMETVRRGVTEIVDIVATFPCHYYGDSTCEDRTNRPVSLCAFHEGEED